MPTLSNSSDVALAEMWTTFGKFTEKCRENAADVGPLIGAAYVARDIMQIVDALGEDGLLRYWGLSYGTTLGATLVAMFPDKVERAVLDGVLNSHEYYAGYGIEQLADADLTLAGFFKSCTENPDLYSLAQDGKSAEELSQKFYHLLSQLKYNPIADGTGQLVFRLLQDYIAYLCFDYTFLKGLVTTSIQDTIGWRSCADALHGLLTNKLTLVRDSATLFNTSAKPIFPNNGIDAFLRIFGSDAAFQTNKLSDLKTITDAANKKSWIYGDSIPYQFAATFQWPFQAKERYEGTFQVKPAKPVLIIGSPYDPLTPLISARNLSAGLKNSVLFGTSWLWGEFTFHCKAFCISLFPCVVDLFSLVLCEAIVSTDNKI